MSSYSLTTWLGSCSNMIENYEVILDQDLGKHKNKWSFPKTTEKGIGFNNPSKTRFTEIRVLNLLNYA